jgi:hypothetical protein
MVFRSDDLKPVIIAGGQLGYDRQATRGGGKIDILSLVWKLVANRKVLFSILRHVPKSGGGTERNYRSIYWYGISPC